MDSKAFEDVEKMDTVESKMKFLDRLFGKDEEMIRVFTLI